MTYQSYWESKKERRGASVKDFRADKGLHWRHREKGVSILRQGTERWQRGGLIGCYMRGLARLKSSFWEANFIPDLRAYTEWRRLKWAVSHPLRCPCLFLYWCRKSLGLIESDWCQHFHCAPFNLSLCMLPSLPFLCSCFRSWADSVIIWSSIRTLDCRILKSNCGLIRLLLHHQCWSIRRQGRPGMDANFTGWKFCNWLFIFMTWWSKKKIKTQRGARIIKEDLGRLFTEREGQRGRFRETQREKSSSERIIGRTEEGFRGRMLLPIFYFCTYST